MSTSTNVESSRRSTVSIESRVVPGTSETITRSRPTSAFRSDDLPTFGRPRIATLIASSPTGRSPWPGSRATISSRRSPEPWPCSAEIGIGSPSPRRWNSSASRSRRGSSSLFASTSTGRRDDAQDLRELLVAGRHARGRVDHEEHEVGLLDGLARLRRDLRAERPGVGRSTPPVSMSRNVVPDHSQRSSLRSRVTPGVSWTTAVARLRQAVDQRRLADVREADDRDRAGDLDRRRASHRVIAAVCASRGRPSSCTPASHSHSFLISRSISTDASL